MTDTFGRRLRKMPQVKQPKSLYHQAKFAVNSLVFCSCKAIELKNGPYGKLENHAAVVEFQSFLLTNIPGHVLDDLCSSLFHSEEERLPNLDGSLQVVLPESFVDFRSLLSIYLHSNMQQFAVDFRLPNDDGFWLKAVQNLRKIVTLNLRMVCTDEILEVISKNCKHLEEINIISKSESCECSNRTFNALKLKYFISDDGLRHLSNCKSLKRIEMNKTLRPQCAGRMMTHEGIKDTVKSLPKLEYISYNNIGTIVNMLANEVDELPMLRIYDTHSEPSHIRAMSKLCPNLQELYLSQPISSRYSKKASAILQALTQSDLKLKYIEIKFFPINKSLNEFLTVKGAYLTGLMLFNTEPITAKLLLHIGVCCPHLEFIHVDDITRNNADLNVYVGNKQPIFTSLQRVALHGSSWVPHIIIPLCLHHAKQLKSLSLVNCGYTGLIDDAVNKLLQVNSLSNVESINMLAGCFVSFSTIVKLVSVCSQLTRFVTVKHPNLNPQDVKNLDRDLRNKNMNIRLTCTPVCIIAQQNIGF